MKKQSIILNNKKKSEFTTSEKTSIIYSDSEKNKSVVIDENKKIAIISNMDFWSRSYYDDAITYILDSDCKVDKEEKIFNRDAVALNYDVNEKYALIGQGTLLVSNIKMWIDTETGLLLQSVVKSKEKEIKIVYNVKLNGVTEDDVAIPDLTGYEVSDISKT